MLYVSLCGGATVFQVTPGFSRGDNAHDIHGVAEPYSINAATSKSVAPSPRTTLVGAFTHPTAVHQSINIIFILNLFSFEIFSIGKFVYSKYCVYLCGAFHWKLFINENKT